jgi:pyruvyltransferase
MYLARNKAELKVLHYCFRNWGDAINPALVEFISGSGVQSVDIDARSLLPLPRDPQADTLYAVVGSIVHHADCQTIIWGAGLQSAGIRPKQPPKGVYAVRGPLTAAELRKQGITCPDVFGDPVLLLPRYYRPEGRKRYRLGIIPHFSDQADGKMARYTNTDEVKVIDIRGPLWSTVNALCECEHIVSTSLHGLILADAYGIPNAWAKLGDSIPGGTFKFTDYYSAIGAQEVLPTVTLTETVDELCRASSRREVALDLDRLLRACPFRWADAPNLHRQAVGHGGAVEAQLP